MKVREKNSNKQAGATMSEENSQRQNMFILPLQGSALYAVPMLSEQSSLSKQTQRVKTSKRQGCKGNGKQKTSRCKGSRKQKKRACKKRSSKDIESAGDNLVVFKPNEVMPISSINSKLSDVPVFSFQGSALFALPLLQGKKHLGKKNQGASKKRTSKKVQKSKPVKNKRSNKQKVEVCNSVSEQSDTSITTTGSEAYSFPGSGRNSNLILIKQEQKALNSSTDKPDSHMASFVSKAALPPQQILIKQEPLDPILSESIVESSSNISGGLEVDKSPNSTTKNPQKGNDESVINTSIYSSLELDSSKLNIFSASCPTESILKHRTQIVNSYSQQPEISTSVAPDSFAKTLPIIIKQEPIEDEVLMNEPTIHEVPVTAKQECVERNIPVCESVLQDRQYSSVECADRRVPVSETTIGGTHILPDKRPDTEAMLILLKSDIDKQIVFSMLQEHPHLQAVTVQLTEKGFSDMQKDVPSVLKVDQIVLQNTVVDKPKDGPSVMQSTKLSVPAEDFCMQGTSQSVLNGSMADVDLHRNALGMPSFTNQKDIQRVPPVMPKEENLDVQNLVVNTTKADVLVRPYVKPSSLAESIQGSTQSVPNESASDVLGLCKSVSGVSSFTSQSLTSPLLLKVSTIRTRPILPQQIVNKEIGPVAKKQKLASTTASQPDVTTSVLLENDTKLPTSSVMKYNVTKPRTNFVNPTEAMVKTVSHPSSEVLVPDEVVMSKACSENDIQPTIQISSSIDTQASLSYAVPSSHVSKLIQTLIIRPAKVLPKLLPKITPEMLSDLSKVGVHNLESLPNMKSLCDGLNSVRLYACYICGQQFSEMSLLSDHFLMHSEEDHKSVIGNKGIVIQKKKRRRVTIKKTHRSNIFETSCKYKKNRPRNVL